VQEIEDPELASQRAREIYKAKGYDDAWIEKRMRGIQVRSELTEDHKKAIKHIEGTYTHRGQALLFAFPEA